MNQALKYLFDQHIQRRQRQQNYINQRRVREKLLAKIMEIHVTKN